MPLALPDYNLTEEQTEFRDSLRRFFEEHAPTGLTRDVMEAGGAHAPDVWKIATAELGLAGIAIAEEYGGQGFGLKELSIALGEAARGLSPIPLFSSAALAGRVVASVLASAGSDETRRELEPIASGRIATLAWLEGPGEWDLDQVQMRVHAADGGFRLSGEKHFVLDAGCAERIYVVAREGDSEALGLFAVNASAAGLKILSKEGLDLSRTIGSLRFEDVAVERVGTGDGGSGSAKEGAKYKDSADAIRRGLTEATALFCSEIVGGMQKVLETAVDYAGERHQFGRAIGSFQAIKHKCADMLIDFECARTAADAAVAALDSGDGDASLLTSVAKAQAGPAFVRMATENIQVHGGVGYTWEYDAHLFFRRARASDAFLGDAVLHQERVAQEWIRRLEEQGLDAARASGSSGRRADTPEEASFRAEVRAWLSENASLRTGEDDWSMGPSDHSLEAEGVYWDNMKAWQKTRFEGGWSAVTWAPEHGGRGGSPIQSIIFNEEQSAFNVASGYIDAAVHLIGPSLIRFGTDEQRERFLKPMLRGDEIWCQLFSEPEAGSDLAAVRTRGVVDGDELVLNGQKVWTTSAQYADWGFIVCRTNVDVPKHKGISFALVDMRQPGVEVRPLVTMKGDRHFNEVFFNDVRTPLKYVVNGIDAGWPVTTFVLMNEGANIGTGHFSRTQTVELFAAAQSRGRLGDPITRQRLAETFVAERVLELLQSRLKGAILDGRRPDVDGSVLKILWSEGGHRKAETANWLQGADALLSGADAPSKGLWQNQLLARGAGTIGGGTSEVHRNGLGERALGLPREPRLDRDPPFKELKISG